jgi:hypothetical protein
MYIITFNNLMEMLENVMWFVLGFAPTIVGLEAAWRINKTGARRQKHELGSIKTPSNAVST